MLQGYSWQAATVTPIDPEYLVFLANFNTSVFVKLGAEVEWLECLSYGAESCRKVLSLRLRHLKT